MFARHTFYPDTPETVILNTLYITGLNVIDPLKILLTQEVWKIYKQTQQQNLQGFKFSRLTETWLHSDPGKTAKANKYFGSECMVKAVGQTELAQLLFAWTT